MENAGIRRSLGEISRACGSALAIITLVASSTLCAQSPKPTDYQVKAAYLYNFGRFVQWPTDSAAGKAPTFMVCVLGQDPFGTILDSTLLGETIDGRTLVARRISDPADAGNCQILFLSSAEAGHWSRVMEILGKRAVLTVSDMPLFSRHGGMIEFVLEENRVRFEVNLAATQHVGLTLSSELLKVATVVRRTAADGE